MRLTLAVALAVATVPQALRAEPQPFHVTNGGVRIRAQLVRPDAPHDTVIVLVGGSGARTIQDTAPMNGLFLGMGFAVVNYDRRGNGGSTGTWSPPSAENSAEQLPLFASDVAAIADHLASEARPPFQTVVLAGSSMGAWVAPLAAGGSEHVDLVVSVSGAAQSVARSDRFDALTDGGLSIPEALARVGAPGPDSSYDPAETLARLRQPALWLYGDLDDSNPTQLDVVTLLRIATTHRKDFTIELYAATNHDMVDTRTGRLQSTFPGHLRDWIEQHSP